MSRTGAPWTPADPPAVPLTSLSCFSNTGNLSLRYFAERSRFNFQLQTSRSSTGAHEKMSESPFSMHAKGPASRKV